MSFDEHEKNGCIHCGQLSTEDYPCPCDCDHSDRDEYCCLICGHEMGEIDACRAEAIFEGDR